MTDWPMHALWLHEINQSNCLRVAQISKVSFKKSTRLRCRCLKLALLSDWKRTAHVPAYASVVSAHRRDLAKSISSLATPTHRPSPTSRPLRCRKTSSRSLALSSASTPATVRLPARRPRCLPTASTARKYRLEANT